MGELGSWLIRAREARGLTIEDAERDTRISRRYLQALESEQYEVIPAPVYARGFLRSYSQYLGLDPVEMLDLFPRDDDTPAPVVGGRSGNVGVGTAQSSRQAEQPKPSMKTPAPAQSAARPNWRMPGRANQSQQQTPMPKRPPARRPAASAAQFEEEDHVVIGANAAAPAPRRQAPPPPAPARQQASSREPMIGADSEPTIGVDIGVPIGSVPLPQRKLQRDPAAPAKNMTVIGVAVGALVLVIALAYVISKLGGGGEPGTTANPTSTTNVSTSRDATASAAASTGNGGSTGVTPGVVPAVEGMTAEKARAAITEAGFKVKETKEKSASVARGIVSLQAPAPGVQQAAGEQVLIVISDGP